MRALRRSLPTGFADGFGSALRSVPPVRPGAGTALALFVVAAAWSLGALHGGLGPRMVASASVAVGLTASGVDISGQVNTSDRDIVAALAWPESGSLVGYDLDTARARLVALPWVEDVTIRKIYPGRLAVSVSEKQPAAVWQADDKLWVIDGQGNRIAAFGITEMLNDRFSHLPHLVGTGADEHAADILPLVAAYPQIAGRVQAYLRLGKRRWDLLLAGDTETTVRAALPEVGLADALDRLAALQDRRQILDRQIAGVDLRLADRMVFDLEPEAVEVRRLLVKDRDKAVQRLKRDAAERPV